MLYFKLFTQSSRVTLSQNKYEEIFEYDSIYATLSRVSEKGARLVERFFLKHF